MRDRLFFSLLFALPSMCAIAALHWLGAVPPLARHVIAGVLAVLVLCRIAMPTRWRPMMSRVLLAATSLIVTIPMLDLLLRATIGPRLHYRPEVTFLRQWPQMPTLYAYIPNVTFEGTVYGDLAAMTALPEHREKRTVHFQTDASGFRNNRADAGKPVDLIVLGDSFGAGAGVTQAETFSDRVAQQLGLTVRNLSISPAGPWGEYLYLREEIERMKLSPQATLVWAFYTGNDLYDPYGPVGDDELPWSSRAEASRISLLNFQRRSPLGEFIKRWTEPPVSNAHLVTEITDPATGKPVLFYKLNREYAGMSREKIVQHENYSHLTKTMAALRDFAAARQMTVKAFILPTKEEVYGWLLDGQPPFSETPPRSGFSIALEELATANGMSFHDTLPDFQAAAAHEYAAGNLLWWRDDTHINGRGHAVVAEAIVRSLQSSSSPEQPPAATPLAAQPREGARRR